MEKNLNKAKQIHKNNRIRKGFVLACVTAAALLAAGAGFSYWYQISKNNQDKKASQEANRLNQPSVSCEETISDLNDVKVDDLSQNTQEEVLELQVNCYSALGDYEKALAAAKKLKGIYEAKKDDRNVQLMDATISGFEDSVAARESIKQYDTGVPIQ